MLLGSEQYSLEAFKKAATTTRKETSRMWTGRVCLFGLLCLTANTFCRQQQVNALAIRGPLQITIARVRQSHQEEKGDLSTSLALSSSNRSEGPNSPRNSTPQPTTLFHHPGLDRKSEDNSIDQNDKKETLDPRLLDPAYNLQRRHEQQRKRRFPSDDQDKIDVEDDQFPARNWDGTINKGWQRIV